MNFPKQDQHKIPQVYLKKFGYIDRNNQWKISALKHGEKFTRQKSIESFTAVTNIFDIYSDDPRIPRMFEQLNCELETEYNNILIELETKGTISDNSYAYLIQFIPNLIVRSDHWRDWMLGMLEHKNKDNFLQIILGHHCKNALEFVNMKIQPFFRMLSDSSPNEIINQVLLYFLDHLLLRLWHYDLTFIQSQDDKPWCTSTNPVVLHQRTRPNEILAKESEIYFPLSPKYMAYAHFKGSADKKNHLRNSIKNTIHRATKKENIKLQHIIMNNPCEYLIFGGEFTYRFD